MKRILALLLALLMIGAVLVGCGKTPDNNDSDTDNTDNTSTKSDMSFKAGFGRIKIALSMPQILAGTYDERPASTTYDDLYVSCTAVRDSEGNTVLLLGADAMYLYASATDPIRAAISTTTGVPFKNILINHSHTHFAPHFYIDKNEDNCKALQEACVNAAKRAIIDLAPCEIYTGVIETEGMTFTRRFVDLNKNGRYEPKTNNEIENPVDENIYVINLEREGDKKDIVLANFASHATESSGGDTKLSTSYYGPCRNTFERTLNKDAYLCLFQGAAGNSIPKAWVETKGAGVRGDGLTWDPSFPGSDKYGEKLAGYINDCLTNNMTKHETKKGVSAESKTLSLVVDKSREAEVSKADEIYTTYYSGNTAKYNHLCKKYGISDVTEAYNILCAHLAAAYLPMELNAVSIGNIGIGTAGYEMLSVTGKEIFEGSPFEFNFVLGYTNDAHKYIPQEGAFENGGYEVNSCLYVKGTAEKIRTEIVKLLDKLYEAK